MSKSLNAAKEANHAVAGCSKGVRKGVAAVGLTTGGVVDDAVDGR